MTASTPPQVPAAAPVADGQVACPTCGADVSADERFCEACGSPLTPTTPTTDGRAAEELESPIELSRPVSVRAEAAPTVPITRPCTDCGGVVGADGYCETCGTKAPSERDHYVERPARWVAACCDRGVRHHRNEDATAIAADEQPGSRAILVVCDGVSTSEDSDVASLAAARAARNALVGHQPAGLGVPASRAAAITAALRAAVEVANEAVLINTAPNSSSAASCTFAAAVLEGDLLVYANVGDSRVYWIADGDGSQLLSVDDSVAQLRIDSGVPRDEAENGPQAHAITKWLGRDSSDHSPTTGSLTLEAPGWVLVCSDGLWNYASEPATLQALVADQAAGPAGEPLALAEALVRWANAQGGKDNISVALARYHPAGAQPGTG